jgi:hypothetical protein
MRGVHSEFFDPYPTDALIDGFQADSCQTHFKTTRPGPADRFHRRDRSAARC